MPVLPEVGSTIVSPGLSRPDFSAASTIARQIRSLTLPPGLKFSSFAQISASSLPGIRLRRTTGVFPIRSSGDCATLIGIRGILSRNQRWLECWELRKELGRAGTQCFQVGAAEVLGEPTADLGE